MSQFEKLDSLERAELYVEQSQFTARVRDQAVADAIADREARGAEETEGITVQGNIDGSRYFVHLPPNKLIDQEGEK